MKRLQVVVGTVALAAAAMTPAFGANSEGVTLHPSGFGAHSYAAWKAHEGEPDDTGKGDHALYLQKDTATTTYAAGVAVFNGIENANIDAASLEVAFDVRTDGVCSLGAPRFNVTVDTVTGPQTLFIGCAAMESSPTEDPRWVHRSGQLPDGISGKVVGLAIVFDEGSDVPRGPGVTSGKTWLDNIQVNNMLWTGPADNSQN